MMLIVYVFFWFLGFLSLSVLVHVYPAIAARVFRLAVIIVIAVLVITILGSVGTSDYQEAKQLEKTICARPDRPDWCISSTEY